MPSDSQGPAVSYPDFGADFREALDKALVAPRSKGLSDWTRICPWCESSLDGVDVELLTVEVELALARISPIQVEVQMPGMHCPRDD